MNLLAGKLYDPAVSVSKVTTALLALTALDTTNLRLAFVVPPSGMVWVRMAGTLHGATTFPQIILGVLEGATVRGRVAPMTGGGNLAATTLQRAEGTFLVTGLTPGASLNWDAAYGVETVVAATGLKYGGPNNTTGNDNFGGFTFEIWDPCPTYTPTSGTAPTTPISARIDTIDDFVDTEIATLITNVAAVQADTDNIQTRLPAALVGGRMDSSVGAMAADVLTAAAIAASALNGKGNWNVGKTGYTLTAATGLGNQTADITGSLSGSVGSVTGAVGSVIGNVAGSVGSVTGLTASDVGAIKAKTDSLTFTVAGQVDANIQGINDVALVGNGSGTPFTV